MKIFSSAQLGVGGEWSAAFPLSLGRFPLQGSGKRYVHGGLSLQEVVVPVVKIHKARADDTGRVEVELLRVPNKITTGQVAVSFFPGSACCWQGACAHVACGSVRYQTALCFQR